MRKEIAVEPVNPSLTLDDVKSYGNMNTDKEDYRITPLLPVATDYVENYTGKALIEQTFNIYYDSFELRNRMKLCSLNVTSIESVTLYDCEGNTTVLDPSNYRLSGKKECWLVFDNGCSYGSLRQIDAVMIQVKAGFGLLKTDIPDTLRTAMNMMVMHWFRNNGAIADGNTKNIPHNVKTMLTPFAPVWNFIS